MLGAGSVVGATNSQPQPAVSIEDALWLALRSSLLAVLSALASILELREHLTLMGTTSSAGSKRCRSELGWPVRPGGRLADWRLDVGRAEVIKEQVVAAAAR